MNINQKEIVQHLSKDRKLKKIIGPVLDKYEKSEKGVYIDLIRSIIGQQVSTASARSVYNKLLALLDTEDYIPNDLLALDDLELQQCGVSRQKRGYLKNVSDFFNQNKLEMEDFISMSDAQVIETLTQIKGVGEWTAQMILIFSLRRPNILPTKDVGIQNAMKNIYGITGQKKELFHKMEEVSKRWKPYRSYACIYLWNSLH